MKSRLLQSLVCALMVLALWGYSSALGDDDWRPIDPAELALKTSVVEKDADAEALFWEVRIDDHPDGDLIFTHYLRIKVFTDRGRESQSKIDLPFGRLYGSEIKIKDIAARTIKADGSIVELKKDDVFERTIVKASGVKVKAKSFAMPAVEAGCVIEYRWREVRVNQSADYIRLQMQRDIPVQQVKYLIKPFPFEGKSFRSITFHGPPTLFKKEKNGFYSLAMSGMRPVYEESRMPPEDEVKTWILVYYASDQGPIDPPKYWSDFGKRFYDVTKQLLKANDQVKQQAAQLTTDAKNDEEKIQRIFEFCRTKIKNINDDASGISDEERKKINNKTPSDTLKKLIGTGADIDLLFAALASAAGFDARIVLSPDRGDIFFDKNLPDAYFLQPSNIAINTGGTWRFFNPGFNYVPFGMLRWQEEGTQALITDPKQPVWIDTPLSPPEKTRVKREAKLTLGTDGTLEGDVRLEYTGHFAIDRKEDSDGDSDTQREDALKEEIKGNMSTAELSNIRIENVTDQVKPIVYSFHVRVPGYAQKTGKRLFVQPAFFQYGVPAVFSASDRKYPIYFHYPWSESDEVEIQLPAGFALDNADAPAPFASSNITVYKPSLSVSSDNKLLVYKRDFFFGGGGALNYPVTTYSQLKGLFDMLHKQDNHSIALKQTTESKP
jgi:hypothetical protein